MGAVGRTGPLRAADPAIPAVAATVRVPAGWAVDHDLLRDMAGACLPVQPRGCG